MTLTWKKIQKKKKKLIKNQKKKKLHSWCHAKRRMSIHLLVWQRLRTLGTFSRNAAQEWVSLSMHSSPGFHWFTITFSFMTTLALHGSYFSHFKIRNTLENPDLHGQRQPGHVYYRSCHFFFRHSYPPGQFHMELLNWHRPLWFQQVPQFFLQSVLKQTVNTTMCKRPQFIFWNIFISQKPKKKLNPKGVK